MNPLASVPTATFFLVDDHPAVCFALKALLEAQPGWRVTSVFGSPSEAMAALERTQPTAVIVDLMFADDSGLDLLEHTKRNHPEVLLLVYSVRPEEHYARRCLKAGARGFVCKDEPIEAIIEAVRRVLGGDYYLSDRLYSTILEDISSDRPKSLDPVAELSNRELQVFELIGQGLDTRAIAQTLCRSIKTIDTYRYRIRQKLTLRNATELAQVASQYLEPRRMDDAHKR